MVVATFSVRMDKKLKEEFDVLCAQFGMNTTVVVNIFARAVVRKHRIPFEISATAPNAGLQAFQALRAQSKKKRSARHAASCN